MAQLRSVGRHGFNLATTLVIGGLVGFVATALITPFLPGPVEPGNRHEPEMARQYVLALLSNDARTLNELELPKNIAQRAIRIKQLAELQQSPAHSLTYLGGGVAEPIGSQVYAIGFQRPGGEYTLVGVSITLVGEKVYYMRQNFSNAAPIPSASPSPAGSQAASAAP
jgi:hypothetical protein